MKNTGKIEEKAVTTEVEETPMSTLRVWHFPANGKTGVPSLSILAVSKEDALEKYTKKAKDYKITIKKND